MKQKSIKKNMIMSIILTISNFIFPLITYAYVARIITPVGTGKVAFVYSILSYFIYVATLGIPTYGLRECAKVRDNKEKLSKLVQELLIISIISTVISYILLFFAVIFIDKLNNYKNLFAIMSIYIFLNTIGVEWFYQSIEEYSYITIRSLIFKTISVILTFVLIRTDKDVMWYGFLTIFTLSANYICNFINLRKYVSLKKMNNYNFKRHLKPILSLLFASIIISIYANFDVVMLGFISTETSVGLYNAALKIKSIILSLSTALTSVIIPRISYYIKQNEKDKIGNLLVKSLRISLLLALPVCIYCFIYAKNVLIFICGVDYIGAVDTLRVLMILVIPLILTNLFGNQLLIPLGKERRFSKSVFVGMWINLILNMLLIPSYGSAGAAFGSLITEIWNVFYMSNGVKEYRKKLIKNVNIYIYLFSLITAILFSILIYRVFLNSLSVFLNLLLTGTVYMFVYYVILLLLKEPLIMNESKKLFQKFHVFYKKIK